MLKKIRIAILWILLKGNDRISLIVIMTFSLEFLF